MHFYIFFGTQKRKTTLFYWLSKRNLETESNNFQRKVYHANYRYIGLHTIVGLYSVTFVSWMVNYDPYVLDGRSTWSFSVGWSVRNVERTIRRAITMNALAEIFYIAWGTGDAATPNIAVPTHMDLLELLDTCDCCEELW